MKWKELIDLAREMAATPPSDRLHQAKFISRSPPSITPCTTPWPAATRTC